MNPDLRKILDNLDDILNGPNRGLAQSLWDVLCALRGPDTEDGLLKITTTAVVRAVAFPKVASRSCATGGPLRASMVADCESSAQTRVQQNMTKFSDHFTNHALNAFAALELSWSHSNDIVTAFDTHKKQIT